MSIFRKEHLKPCLNELDSYYKNLRNTIEGSSPNVNLAHDYNYEVEQFKREFTEVDLDALTYAIAHFKVAVDGLKEIKKRQSKPNHKG